MFGGKLVHPKCNKRTKPNPMRYDIQFPGCVPGQYAHIAREPNTDYHVQYLHYKQKKISADLQTEERERKTYLKDATTLKYDQHAEKKHLQRLIQDKVQQKLKAYEETVEERRKKLQELLSNEERAYYYETVELAQKGDEMKMDEMKKRAELLRAQREAERLKLVEQKRIEQYSDRCQELRPYLIKKHLIETKNAQLQQIRENEAKREADKEMEKMWYYLNTREIEARMEREEQDVIARKQKQIDLQEIWDKQIKGKDLLKAEVEKVAQEDRMEMLKLADQLRREEIEALDSKRRKRDQTAKELKEQIIQQEKLLKQRQEDERTLAQAFTKLAELEIEKEKQSIKDFTTLARRETALYRKHLRELEEERKKEEKELNELLEMHRKEIERKQDEAKCKLLEAKLALQKDVLLGRAQQLEYKRQEAEQQLKLKEAENELLRMTYDQNERLQAEQDRLEAEEVRQYRADLNRQIEYNNVLRQREQEELERQLLEGQREEETYRKIIEDMIKGQVEKGSKHPFRRVLERHDCHCPSN